MRIDVPGTEHWIELRDPEALTAADEDAWQHPVEQAWATAWQAHPDDPEARQQKVRQIAYTPEYAYGRRDGLLASLITAWSFTDLPLPYRPEYRSSLPLAASKALKKATGPHEALLNDDGDDGPKETGTGGSTSPGSSAEPSPRPLPDSPPPSTETATG